MRLRHIWSVLLCFLLALVAYAGLPQRPLDYPDVTFQASTAALTSGSPVTLSWNVRGPSGWDTYLLPGVGRTTGTQVTLTPRVSSTYTLLVQNPLGSMQRDLRVEVQGAPAPAGAAAAASTETPVEAPSTVTGGALQEDGAPSGTFGVGERAEGPFFSDRAGGITAPDDERVVRVAPGGSFFAQASFRDPDGVAEVVVSLVNSAPEGLSGALAPERPPFTLAGEPGGSCNLTALPTEVRCVFEIRVAEGAQNIDALPGAGEEFAYVLRVRATDGLGNSANRPIRGYVVIEP